MDVYGDLHGTLTSPGTISGSLSGGQTIAGSLTIPNAVLPPAYPGPYEVTPTAEHSPVKCTTNGRRQVEGVWQRDKRHVILYMRTDARNRRGIANSFF